MQAPPSPYHILAQQLMALILQERGIGRSHWFSWIARVPGFAQMPTERVAELVDAMLAKGILWSDEGILSFAPEGENTFGRRNFMDLLSVFTSPPLFSVVSGQKELGNVHESTFYKREDGPAILALAGRSWKTKHLDWKRRIAYVEPTDEKGRSRWLGAGQLLSHAVCQSIRRIVAGEEQHPTWSRRAVDQFAQIRAEHPWASAEDTTVVRSPGGEIRWWTFAGGVVNTLLSNALQPRFEVKSDNLSLSFTTVSSLDELLEAIESVTPEEAKPVPNPDAIENLKFSECLSADLAAHVFTSRFDDRAGVQQALSEPRRVVLET